MVRVRGGAAKEGVRGGANWAKEGVRGGVRERSRSGTPARCKVSKGSHAGDRPVTRKGPPMDAPRGLPMGTKVPKRGVSWTPSFVVNTGGTTRG
eukprot:scaffold266601_cov26-Tisochrysis_lutea.AAC.1